MNLSRRHFLRDAAAAFMAPLYPAPSSNLGTRFGGINLAGAEFGDEGQIPGIYDVDFSYPTNGSVDYFRRRGFNLIRLPFRWERLQPKLFAEFSSDEEKRLRTLSNYITAQGMTLVLNPCNFARRKLAGDGWNKDYLIGSSDVPTASFVDFWVRLASLFRDSRNAIFGLMNEPYDISAPYWLEIVNRLIAAIRKAGASNFILVPGVEYTSAHTWITAGNELMYKVEDPAMNFAFEVHQYLDFDSSGTHPEVVSGTIGSERIRDFEGWAREHGFRAFLGEFGASGDSASCLALTNLCKSISESPDIWLGWAAWAAGPRWPEDYIFNLEPQNGKDRPQTKILASFAREMNR
jgi:endoglucanase